MSDNEKAPERVWLHKVPLSHKLMERWYTHTGGSGDVEYIRADLVERVCPSMACDFPEDAKGGRDG